MELLDRAAGRTAGIPAYEQVDVYSDVSAPINTNGYVTIKVEDTNGEFHQLRQQDPDVSYQVWLNSGI